MFHNILELVTIDLLYFTDNPKDLGLKVSLKTYLFLK